MPFSQQNKPLVNDSVLPHFSYLTDKRLVSIPFTGDDIIGQIRSLNPAKSYGPDGISSKMLILADDSIVLPLMLIFTNILTTGISGPVLNLLNNYLLNRKHRVVPNGSSSDISTLNLAFLKDHFWVP